MSLVKRRIAMWVAIGFLVACCWTIYAFLTAPDYEITMGPIERVVWILARVTCPAVLVGLRFYWVLLANAATYGLIGLIVELLRRYLNSPSLKLKS